MRDGLRGAALILLWFMAAAGAAQESVQDPAGQPVEVRHWTDRSALFPGDRLVYEMEIRTDPRFDILVEELQPAQLPLTGLEVLGFEHRREETAAGVRHYLRYRLTSYAVAPASPGIAERRIPYYGRRPGQGLEGGPPAGNVTVPPVTIALRSTLPGEAASLALRDQSANALRSGGGAWLAPLGWVLLLIAVVPVSLWAVPGLRRRLVGLRRQRRLRPQATAVQNPVAHLLELELGSAADRREAYDRLDSVLREWLASAAGPGVGARTAEELATMAGSLRDPAAAAELTRVLADCERVRYGGSGQLPAGERFREQVTAMQDVIDRA